MAARTRLEPRLALAVGVAAVVVVIAGVVLLGGSRPGAGTTPSAGVAASGSARPTSAPAPPGPSASAAGDGSSPTATSAGSAAPGFVLVGAGDIASCSSDGDEATAKLLDGLEGTVFTLGDNAYEHGSPDEFRQCYDPTWGGDRARTRPVPGNHEYETRGAAGYFEYFGAAAGNPGEGWYAYDAGSWRVYVLNSNCALVGGCCLVAVAFAVATLILAGLFA